MNRCTCDIPNCNGMECYFATPTDDEAIEPRTTVYTPSADYLEWLASLTDCGPDPLRHLEPKRRAA